MEQKQNSLTNNKQVFRDYRLALYQEEPGTVDLQFEDESDDSHETDRIDVVGFERDFAEDCKPGSDLGYVLLTNGMSNRRMNVPPDLVSSIKEPVTQFDSHSTKRSQRLRQAQPSDHKGSPLTGL